MSNFWRKNIVALTLILLAIVIGSWFWWQKQQDPNNLQRRYTLADFPAVAGREGYQEHVDKLNESLDFLQQAVKVAPAEERYEAWNNVGLRKLALEDYDGAMAAWQEAIKVNARNPLVYANMANVQKIHYKNYPAAEALYQLAIAQNESADPYFPDYEGLADLYKYYYTEKAGQIELVMLSGLDKAITTDIQLPFLIYLTNYYKELDAEKYQSYRQRVLAIDPALESQFND